MPARNHSQLRRWPIALAFNGGRIATYALAGSAAGAAGSLLLFVDGTLPVQRIMYAVANLMLPAHTLPRAAGLGALWGWMPCGLVYSVLAIALMTGCKVPVLVIR